MSSIVRLRVGLRSTVSETRRPRDGESDYRIRALLSYNGYSEGGRLAKHTTTLARVDLTVQQVELSRDL